MWFDDLATHILNRVGPRPKRARVSGVSLGRNGSDAVVWPDARRCEHMVIVGKTGTGKTHFLEHLALSLASRNEGFAFIDFHGDSSLALAARLRDIHGLSARIVLLDPSHPTRSPSINVLATAADEASRFRKVSELSAILRQRWGVDSFGARTEELLRNSLYTLAASQRPLTDLPQLLSDVHFRQNLTDACEQPEIASYWRDRYEPLSEAMKAAFREPLLNKVTGFLTEPAARHLLGQANSTIGMTEVMAGGKWLILRLPKGRLRGHAHTLGNLLFAQLQFAAMARDSVPVQSRQTFTILCDEVQNLAENDLEVLLTEGRKFGISMVTANQHWAQLPHELRGALLSAGSHVFFRVSTTDAGVLAGELSLERRQPLTHALTELDRGEAVGRLGNSAALRLRVPALPRTRPLDQTEMDTLLSPVTRLRQQIEQGLRRQVRQPVRRAAVTTHIREGQHDW